MALLNGLFQRDKVLIGMVHVGALPGTPRAVEPVSTLAARAADEAALLVSAGYDGVLIENMHDVPYILQNVGPEVVAAMTAVALAVRRAAGSVPCGIQILAGANQAALAVAAASGLSFIRAEGFVFASVADEGLIAGADAPGLLRYRRVLGLDGRSPSAAGCVRILADIKKKHSSHAITGDISLGEMARAALFFGADGVIVTGSTTGEPADLADLRAARDAVRQCADSEIWRHEGTAGAPPPVFVGSGVDPSSVRDVFLHADGVIVGSALKREGKWFNPLDIQRVREMAAAADAARA